MMRAAPTTGAGRRRRASRSRVAMPINAVRRSAAVAALGGAIALSLGAWGCAQSNRSAATTQSSAAPAPAASAAQFLGKHYPAQGHVHLPPGTTDTFKYNSDPPTSGPHRELFTSQFISPNPLPAYVQVHLLEHGNVLVQYSCSCPDVAAQLADIAGEFDNRLYPSNELQPTPADVQNAEEQGLAVIVAPYPNMKSKIALTAWTRLATLDTADKVKVISFINAWLSNQANLSQ